MQAKLKLSVIITPKANGAHTHTVTPPHTVTHTVTPFVVPATIKSETAEKSQKKRRKIK